jgi:hypothetical protein
VFASIPAGIVETSDDGSFPVDGKGDATADDKVAAMPLVIIASLEQRGRPVGLIHKRVDYWIEHFCPEPTSAP